MSWLGRSWTKIAQIQLLKLQKLGADLVENMTECAKNMDNLTKTAHELEKEVEDMRLVNDTLRLDASRDRHMFQYRVASLEALVQDMMARLPQDTTSVPGSCADTSPPEPEDATSAPGSCADTPPLEPSIISPDRSYLLIPEREGIAADVDNGEASSDV